MDRDPQAEARPPQPDKGPREAAYNLQALTRRLVEVEELERHRIAGELHDRVGQALSALNINLDIALGLVPPDQVEVKVRIADSLSLVESMLQTIESLMAELRPPLLDEYGLGAALGMYAKGFAQRTGVRIAVEDPHEAGRGLRPDASIALFRIAQEALANIAKHARARNTHITLKKAPDALVMEIADDGCGFDLGERLARSARWGMTTMHERAAAVGALLEVESTLGGGTSVRVLVPPAAAP